jgi:3',5'-cyclic AMP phosphodiesterase CpdA
MAPKPGKTLTNLSETIRRDLERVGIKNIGGLLISGDLTWRGGREEFEWAKKFINDTQSWAKLTASDVLVCPGNHDLAFSNEPWTKGTPATATDEASAAELHALL